MNASQPVHIFVGFSSAERRQKFLKHFQQLQQNGRVTVEFAWKFFSQSRLSREVKKGLVGSIRCSIDQIL